MVPWSTLSKPPFIITVSPPSNNKVETEWSYSSAASSPNAFMAYMGQVDFYVLYN
jgi:hypothetical protein